jgi:ribosomal protein S18 acetylase RimI-like enzyme
MAGDLVFVSLEPARLDEVRAMMRAAFTPYLRRLGREMRPDAYGWFNEAIVQGDIFAAVDGAEIVGAIATKRKEGELVLENIGVSPARQKQGIASWMIGQIEGIARARGVGLLSLITAEMMEDRIRLYERHGFAIVRRGLLDDGKVDAHMRVYMEKPLG